MPDILAQLKDIRDSFNFFSKKVNEDKDYLIHKDNSFNRKFSVILSAFEDIYILGERLRSNIEESIRINGIIQQRNKLEDKDNISSEGQELRKVADGLDRFNRVDFKALYIFSKIFLDQYTDLLSFIFSFETNGIRFRNRYGSPSVTTLFHSLNSYNGDNKIINDFKNACFKKFKAVNVFLTQYRDEYVVHKNVDSSVGTWFINEMNSGIRFLTQRPSITPAELIFVVRNCIIESVNFILDNKARILIKQSGRVR
jgi:hypothetical protein